MVSAAEPSTSVQFFGLHGFSLMTQHRLTLSLLAPEFAVVRLSPDAAVPNWAHTGAFSSITRTAEELSIVCEAASVPSDAKHATGWRALKFHGPFAFSETGVLASVVAPLAAAGVSVFAISTYDTDYLLLRDAETTRALSILRDAGHTILLP